MHSQNRSSTGRMNPGIRFQWFTGAGFSAMLALTVGLIFYPVSIPAASQQPPADTSLILPAVRPDDSGAITRNHHPGTGMTRFLAPSRPGFALAQPAPLDPSAPVEAAARHFLNSYGKWFGIQDPQRELKRLRVRELLDRGRSSVRFQQAYQNIPVLAGEMIVNLDAAKNVTSVSGKVLPDPSLDPTPQLDAAMAQTIALQAVAKWYQAPEYELEVSPATLWIYNPVLLTSTQGLTALVWRMEVRALGLAPVRELVLVDARKGNIVLHFNQIDNAKSLKTHTMNGSSNDANLPGSLVCTYPNDLICAAGDADAKAAHGYGSDTYNFYLNTHGRDSIDGAGMTIISSVHYGVGYQNAFWDGQQMVYGDGFSAADDVVGHELTHGVTEHESNLFYYYQSGAINESFSDVWGEFVDLSNGKGTDTSGVRWLIGEDIPGIGAIRSMSNPLQFGDPDKITSANYYLGASDQGGVHTNSGVNNKAAYLMTDGASFNGFTVTSLGIQKVAKIYYEAQTNLLTSGSDYTDLYDALRQACSNLIGTAGITSGDCAQVENALNAVEMNQQPVTGFNPDAPLCPSGQQVAAQPFFDNVEAGGNKWTTSTLSGTNNPWFLISDYAASGTKSFWVNDINSVSDSVLTMANSIAVPTGAYLHFRHAFGFESGNSVRYDGGVVEYSTNNGGTWTDLGALFVDGQAYGGSLSTSFSNPLGGRSAFVADSHGYVSSRYNLASLSGQSLRVRFRQGTDSSTYGPLGWIVDDVRIYNCSVITYALTVSKSGAGSGTVASSPAGINCGADCGESYPANTVVTLSASPAGGSVFGGWSGACSGTGGCTVTMNAAKSVVATFNPAPPVTYALTVTKSGAGSGTVASSPAGINCGADCGESYPANTVVTLSASPAGGSVFGGWSGACSGTGGCTVTMNAAKSVVATFNPAPPVTYALTVTKSGAGSGTVASNPAGIDCGADCGESYPANTVVTLSATPAGGSVFGGWSGACSGTGGCTVTMNAAKGVVATFNPVGQTPAQHTVGLYNPAASAFYLRTSHAGGAADLVFGFGPPNAGWKPLAGDWDGDGTTTVGLYEAVNSTFFLKNGNAPGPADVVFRFGPPNAGWTPLAGDWDGNGTTTVGLYNPATSTFYLKNSHAGGAADQVYGFGPPNAGWKPLVGDWDGDGADAVGLYDPATSTFYLKNGNAPGPADRVYGFGPPNAGWTPLAGDWDGDGTTTVGLFDPAASVFYLRDGHAGGPADRVYGFGPPSAGWVPLAGDWNGPGL